MNGEAIAARISASGERRWTDQQVIEATEVAAFRELHGYDQEGSADIAPPGFAAILVQRAVLHVLHDPELDLPFDRNLHAAQALEWVGILRTGTPLTTTARVENVRPRDRAVFFDVRTVTTDDSGEVLRGVATEAVRHG